MTGELGQDQPARSKIAVVGTTGTGKTTLAKQLAKQYGVIHVELDSLYWQADWKPIEGEKFRNLVAEAVVHDRWVADGNYRAVRDIVWTKADIIVWLDYSLPLILWRLFRRYTARIGKRELLWGVNRETIRKTFFRRDSLFIYAVKTNSSRRREYSELFRSFEYRHATVFHLTSPGKTDEWLEHIAPNHVSLTH